MVKKVITTFSDTKALRLLGILISSLLGYCVVALLLPDAFTAGAGDWYDAAYYNDSALLRDDQMRASYILGICSTVFVVANSCVIWRYAAVVRHRKHRLAITIAATVLAAWFAMTVAGLKMASYVPM